MDRYYSVPTGLVTIVTGWPGSGKSEWLDALLVHLGHQGWKIAIFSPENQPLELHAAKHMEKVSGKPFGHGPTERIGFDEIPEFLDELAGWFHFIHAPSVETSLTVRSVIEAATPWLEKQGPKRGLVMDPWNELEHWRPRELSETEYISQTLSYVRNWARPRRSTSGSWRTRRNAPRGREVAGAEARHDFRLAALVEQGGLRHFHLARSRRTTTIRGRGSRPQGALQAYGRVGIVSVAL
jgi:hypothetical protein